MPAAYHRGNNIAAMPKVLQELKISMARRLSPRPFWQYRFHDFNVFTDRKRIEKRRRTARQGRCALTDDDVRLIRMYAGNYLEYTTQYLAEAFSAGRL